MSDNITLFCLVHGEPIANAFAVDIDENMSISHLKKLIKSEKAPEFDDIDANNLVLWKVNIHEDDETTIQHLLLNNGKANGIELMRPTWKISKYFLGGLTEEHIHVIVERPARKCYFYMMFIHLLAYIIFSNMNSLFS